MSYFVNPPELSNKIETFLDRKSRMFPEVRVLSRKLKEL